MNAPASNQSSPAVNHFCFESNKVRTFIDEHGEPWFVAKDICDILNLTHVSTALRKIPEKHKGVYPIHTLGGRQNISAIDEPGLYRLILRSDKPQAEPFMEWITSEVIPSIRKTGSYSQTQPTTTQPKKSPKPKPIPAETTYHLESYCRPFTYQNNIEFWTYTDSDRALWFNFRDIVTAMGYSNDPQSYRWMLDGDRTLMVTTVRKETFGGHHRMEEYVSASTLKRLLLRSGKRDKFEFANWIDGFVLPTLGQQWRLNGAIPKTMQETVMERMSKARFLLSFSPDNRMVLRELAEEVSSLPEHHASALPGSSGEILAIASW